MTKKKEKKSSSESQVRPMSPRDMKLKAILGNDYKPDNSFRSADSINETDGDYIAIKGLLDNYARSHHLIFNPNRDKVKMLKKITAMGGMCLCRPSVKCPCPEALDDIEKDGFCTCKLFAKKQGGED